MTRSKVGPGGRRRAYVREVVEVAMRFVLEVDTSGFEAEEVERELGRILRYWAGNLKHYALKPGDGCEISDSAYRVVGRWQLTEAA